MMIIHTEMYYAFLLILLSVHLSYPQTVKFSTPASCTASQFYDSITLQCKACPSVGSERAADGLSCKCQNGFKYKKNFGDPAGIQCEACPTGKVASSDGWSCVACPDTTYDTGTKTCTSCNSLNQATTERQLDGSPFTMGATGQVRNCTLCTAGTFPSRDNSRCVPCNQNLQMLNSQLAAGAPAVTDCDCSSAGVKSGGVCFPNGVLETAGSNTFKVSTTGTAPTSVTSAYFTEYVLSTYGLCLVNYNNITACQSLSNMCALLLFNRRNIESGNGDACALHHKLKNTKSQTVAGFLDWRTQLPWLFYASATAKAALTSNAITSQYSRTSTLSFRFAEFMLNGTFVGMKNGTNGFIQLCSDSVTELNAAYKFGTYYLHTCNLGVDDLFNQAKYPLRFLDPYIEFTDANSEKRLLPIPVRILNLVNRAGATPNTGTNNQNWLLTRRFFLVDNVAAIQPATTVPSFVRYAKSIEITIQPQASEDGTINKNGLIYPPYITIDYATAPSTDLNSGKSVQVSFSVKYTATLTKFNYDLSVAMGVLCALAFCFAAVRTWSWTRRSGIVAFDIVTIVKLLVFNAAAISNVFLLVTASTALYYLLFYKNQSVFAVFLPTAEQDRIFIIYISIAFGLKVMDVLHIIVSQCTIDIFFIDWERGKTKVTSSGEDSKTVQECSIWRTYFCANEWNEIQTYRKVNRTLLIIIGLFFLEVLGFIRFSSADTEANRFVTTGTYRAPDNIVFRYALIVAVFSITGVVQWAFHLLIYEKFFEDKLRNYVDLCSVANISVFVMAHKQFGYYIHGQSVHGTADVGLRTMYDQLQKEQENLCAKRGLEVDSDQQTYMMALPTNMRQNFDTLYAPFADGRNIEKGLETYKQLNKFLSQFISRSDANNMKYHFVNRRLFEDILDCEFDDSTSEGHFYKDDGNAFGNVLFYGHELSLITFDILAFCVVDLIAQNIILDGIITWILGKLVDMLRDNLSRKNLARKTLVDDRFLI